jgi:hypothetical protein
LTPETAQIAVKEDLCRRPGRPKVNRASFRHPDIKIWFSSQDLVQQPRLGSAARRNMMTPKQLADALENIDEEAFASLLLEFELSHDDGPMQVKTMIIDALRFAGQHGMPISRAPLDDAD